MKKIAIVGAGIIGVCISHFLKKSGHQVILFDQYEPGTQTSFGNAGIFANHDCVFANSPHLWKDLPGLLFKKDGYVALDWFYIITHLPWMLKFLRNCTSSRVNHIAKSLCDFSFHAEAAYQDIFNEIDVSNYIVKKDSIYLYESENNFAKGQYLNNLRKKFGVPFDIVNKEKISEMEPSLANVYTKGIIFREESYTRSSLKITQAIFNNFINNGGKFFLKKINKISRNEKGLHLVFENKKFYADKIVVAAGAWSNDLAETINDSFPLDTERGYHIVFESNKKLISRSVGWAKTGFYLTPMEDGIRAAGTVEIAGLKKPMNKKRLKIIEDSSRKLIPELGKIKSKWMGFRPTLPDSLPVIGESKKCKNVYYAFGHQHLGLSLGALTGKVVKSLVEDKKSNISINSFDPYRF